MPGFEVVGREERDAVNDVFDHAGGVLFRHGFEALRNGSFRVRDFEQAFAARLAAPHALAVTSGTAAVKVGLWALGVRPGDEVVTQSFTFVATVEAILELGATPVVTEVDATYGMDPADLERRITARTKAIVPVHMMGGAASLDGILAVARKHKVPVLEDTAQAVGGSYRGRALGTHGDVGTFSFDFGKALTTGEGGMVVFRDDSTHARGRAYHDHGHENNPKLPRGKDTRSFWGFNYRMMELQGAIGLAQLRKLDGLLERQRINYGVLERVVLAHPELEARRSGDPAGDTRDTLAFAAPDAPTALRIHEALAHENLGTKILPESFDWHFAGRWDHMFGRKAATGWPRSAALLERSVALPVMVHMDPHQPERLARALEAALARRAPARRPRGRSRR